MEALKASKSPITTNLILNTAVMLKDGKPGYEFSITKDDVNQSSRYIDARIAYLAGQKPPERRKR